MMEASCTINSLLPLTAKEPLGNSPVTTSALFERTLPLKPSETASPANSSIVNNPSLFPSFMNAIAWPVFTEASTVSPASNLRLKLVSNTSLSLVAREIAKFEFVLVAAWASVMVSDALAPNPSVTARVSGLTKKFAGVRRASRDSKERVERRFMFRCLCKSVSEPYR